MKDELTRFLERHLPGESRETIAVIVGEVRRLIAEAEDRGRLSKAAAGIIGGSIAKVMGARGGAVGGPARAAAMTPEARRECARQAARARWAKRTQSVGSA